MCVISGLLFPKIGLVGGRLIITWNVAVFLTYLQVYCIRFGASLVPGYCIFTASLLHPGWICMASWLLWQVEQTPGNVWFGAECLSTPGTHYTNGLWAHNPNFLYKKEKKSNIQVVLMWIVVIHSGHNFAHATTAELSWHVQNSDLIWWLYFK